MTFQDLLTHEGQQSGNSVIALGFINVLSVVVNYVRVGTDVIFGCWFNHARETLFVVLNLSMHFYFWIEIILLLHLLLYKQTYEIVRMHVRLFYL